MSLIRKKSIHFLILYFFTFPLFSSVTNVTTTSSSDSTIQHSKSTTSVLPQHIISDKTVGQHIATIKDTTSTYPETIMLKNSDGTYTCQQALGNRISKNAPPPTIKKIQQISRTGLLHTQSPILAPSGSTLFQSRAISTITAQDLTEESVSVSSIGSQFDTLMSTLSNNQDFVQFFRKVHLNILNELYEHLMNIYTNFNLQHPGSTSVNGSLSINISDYLIAEETYAINLKTLIVNHLVNLIEEQFNSAVVAVMPTVPQLLATKVGKITILSDYSVDLTEFIVQDISRELTNSQSTYLQALQQYLKFFQSYTSLISVADDTTGFSQYCSVAEHINDQLSTTDMNTMLTKMNPPMFFYDEDTMRALRIIPHLAKKIPSNTSSVGWPQAMKDNAANMVLVKTSSSTHPIAYYTDANGTITTSEAQAKHLYACIQTGANFFQEELLQQPNWLNSEEGILNILRACLGDFTALIGMGILDCCMETLISNAMNLSTTSSNNIATSCQSLISTWQTNSANTNSTTGATTGLPPLPTPGLPPLPTPGQPK